MQAKRDEQRLPDDVQMRKPVSLTHSECWCGEFTAPQTNANKRKRLKVPGFILTIPVTGA
jgi:hypothetical protein